jgi:SAM-dependent methyltransferase
MLPYSQWLRDVRNAVVISGRTCHNVLSVFPSFVAHGWGSYVARSRLTIACINGVFPALDRVGNSAGKPRLLATDHFDRAIPPAAVSDEERLADLLNKHGSDKASTHDYHLVYSALFKDLGTPKKILEIGLGTCFTDVVSTMGRKGRPGASLRAFRDFNASAHVIGLDIDRRVLFSEDRIDTFYVDQMSSDSFSALVPKVGDKFDLMIDDGLHSPLANLNSIQFFMPLVRTGGWIVIEDVAYDSIPVWQVVAMLLEHRFKTYFLRRKAAGMVLLQKIREI